MRIKLLNLLFYVLTNIEIASISSFVKFRPKKPGMTQQEFADRSGVALTVIRKIEQGNENLNLTKVNQVLMMFGHVLGPVSEEEYAKGIGEVG